MSAAAEFWEGRYGEREQIWSGRPNDALVDTVGPLVPGRAIDLGCGEGGDSIWLAGHRWRVTAVDVASVAVERARAAAAANGSVDGSIDWVVADLESWTPAGHYDLVSACFLHSPVEFPRVVVLRRCAASLRQGGHLLIVGHAAAPPWSKLAEPDGDGDDEEGHGGHGHHHFLTPAEELDTLALPDDSWATVTAEVRTREATRPDNGERATLEDTVVLLRRC